MEGENLKTGETFSPKDVSNMDLKLGTENESEDVCNMKQVGEYRRG
jgi:hypothetical protein